MMNTKLVVKLNDARMSALDKWARISAMKDKHHVDLVQLEDDLSTLEQHAKHVVSLLGRRVVDLGERVAALEQSGVLFQEIREIKDRVHALRTKA